MAAKHGGVCCWVTWSWAPRSSAFCGLLQSFLQSLMRYPPPDPINPWANVVQPGTKPGQSVAPPCRTKMVFYSNFHIEAQHSRVTWPDVRLILCFQRAAPQMQPRMWCRWVQLCSTRRSSKPLPTCCSCCVKPAVGVPSSPHHGSCWPAQCEVSEEHCGAGFVARRADGRLAAVAAWKQMAMHSWARPPSHPAATLAPSGIALG